MSWRRSSRLLRRRLRRLRQRQHCFLWPRVRRRWRRRPRGRRCWLHRRCSFRLLLLACSYPPCLRLHEHCRLALLMLDLGRLTNLARRRRWRWLQRWDLKRWRRWWRALSPCLYPEDAGARLENIGEEPIQEGGILFGIHTKSPNVGELKHAVEEGSALHAAIGAVAAHVAPPILASFCSHFGLVVIVLLEERPRYTNKEADVKFL